jgi:hypothetical protein
MDNQYIIILDILYNKCLESLKIDKKKEGIYPADTKQLFISYVIYQFNRNRISFETKEKYINDINSIT